MLPHSKLDLCASLTLSISVLQDTKPPAARRQTHAAKLHLALTLRGQNICGPVNMETCAVML